MPEVLHNCGVNFSYDLSELYYMTEQSSHRGREAFGFAAIGDDGIDVIKCLGTPRTFDLADMSRLLSYNKPYAFLSHVRYSTRGGKGPEELLEAAHPHILDGRVEKKGNHIIVRNASSVMVHNGQIEQKYLDGVDRALLEKCDTLGALDYMNKYGEYKFIEDIPYAYTLIYATPNTILAVRDKLGVRSGYYGVDKSGKGVIASENIMLQKVEARHILPLERGSIYYCDRNGNIREQKTDVAENVTTRPCSFEWLYISDSNSQWENVSINGLRIENGVELAHEFPFRNKKNVIVTYAPRCPVTAAYTYAKKLGYRFEHVFYKLSHIRSFQGPSADEREQSIRENLFKDEFIDIRDATLIIIDDSGIRGTVRKRLKELLKDSGVREAIYLCYTPVMCPIIDGKERGCTYGVDMPPDNPEKKYISRIYEKDKKRWRNKTHEEFMQDKLPTYFLSLEGSHRAFERLGLSRDKRCSYCYGGIGPE